MSNVCRIARIALSCNLTLYVVADTGVHGILRCVLIVVPDSFKINYIVHSSPRADIPQLSLEQLGYLGSNDVLVFHVHLWVAL